MKAWEPPKLMTTDEENYFTAKELRQPPAPDPLVLLVRCKEVLQKVSEQKTMVRTIEQYEDFEGGEPSLGTFKTLGQLKTIANEANALLSDIAAAGVK